MRRAMTRRRPVPCLGAKPCAPAPDDDRRRAQEDRGPGSHQARAGGRDLSTCSWPPGHDASAGTRVTKGSLADRDDAVKASRLPTVRPGHALSPPVRPTGSIGTTFGPVAGARRHDTLPSVDSALRRGPGARSGGVRSAALGVDSGDMWACGRLIPADCAPTGDVGKVHHLRALVLHPNALRRYGHAAVPCVRGQPGTAGGSRVTSRHRAWMVGRPSRHLDLGRAVIRGGRQDRPRRSPPRRSPFTGPRHLSLALRSRRLRDPKRGDRARV